MAQEFNVMQLLKFVVYNLHMRFMKIVDMPTFPSKSVGFQTNTNFDVYINASFEIQDDTIQSLCDILFSTQ